MSHTKILCSFGYEVVIQREHDSSNGFTTIVDVEVRDRSLLLVCNHNDSIS